MKNLLRQYNPLVYIYKKLRYFYFWLTLPSNALQNLIRNTVKVYSFQNRINTIYNSVYINPPDKLTNLEAIQKQGCSFDPKTLTASEKRIYNVEYGNLLDVLTETKRNLTLKKRSLNRLLEDHDFATRTTVEMQSFAGFAEAFVNIPDKDFLLIQINYLINKYSQAPYNDAEKYPNTQDLVAHFLEDLKAAKIEAATHVFPKKTADVVDTGTLNTLKYLYNMQGQLACYEHFFLAKNADNAEHYQYLIRLKGQCETYVKHYRGDSMHVHTLGDHLKTNIDKICEKIENKTIRITDLYVYKPDHENFVENEKKLAVIQTHYNMIASTNNVEITLKEQLEEDFKELLITTNFVNISKTQHALRTDLVEKIGKFLGKNEDTFKNVFNFPPSPKNNNDILNNKDSVKSLTVENVFSLKKQKNKSVGQLDITSNTHDNQISPNLDVTMD